MTGNDDRHRRDLDLLMKSFRALEAEQSESPADEASQERDGRRQSDQTEPASGGDVSVSEPSRQGRNRRSRKGDDDVVMYRGRPVRRSGSGTPGAGSSQARPTQFRGAGGQNRRKGGMSKGSNSDRIKQALATLAEMHEEGLITKAEYDAKRRQLLNRL